MRCRAVPCAVLCGVCVCASDSDTDADSDADWDSYRTVILVCAAHARLQSQDARRPSRQSMLQFCLKSCA